MKKQTYIQNICSIILSLSIDMRMPVRYNTLYKERLFATYVLCNDFGEESTGDKAILPKTEL